MRLVIRTVDGCRVPGGRALVLCDEHGAFLPGQCRVELVQDEEEGMAVTVTFEIDGKDVILNGSLVHDPSTGSGQDRGVE